MLWQRAQLMPWSSLTRAFLSDCIIILHAEFPLNFRHICGRLKRNNCCEYSVVIFPHVLVELQLVQNSCRYCPPTAAFRLYLCFFSDGFIEFKTRNDVTFVRAERSLYRRTWHQCSFSITISSLFLKRYWCQSQWDELRSISHSLTNCSGFPCCVRRSGSDLLVPP